MYFILKAWTNLCSATRIHMKSLDLTGDLFSPADHEDQLLVGQVGEGHHHAGLGERLLHVLHEVDLRRLRLHDAGDELLRPHGRVVRVVGLREGGERCEGSLQVEVPLGPRTQPHPDQTPACGIPRLESTAAVSGSSIAAAFTPYTWSTNTARERVNIYYISSRVYTSEQVFWWFGGL